MKNIRVSQLAKKLEMDNKTLLSELKQLGVSVKSHLSVLTGETAKSVYEKLKNKKKKSGVRKTVKKDKKAAAQKEKTKTKTKIRTKTKTGITTKAKEKAKKDKEKEKPKKKEKPQKKEKPKVKTKVKPKKIIEKKKEPVRKKEPDKIKESVLEKIEKKTEDRPKEETIQIPLEEKIKAPPEKLFKASLEFKESPTVGELAGQLQIKPSELIKNLMSRGIMASINQRLEKDVAVVVAEEFGFQAKKIDIDKEQILSIESIVDEEKYLHPRSPVVTIMGHVDHGKTTLLDYIRKSKIVEGETGQITQHIGAYEVKLKEGKVVFLDTPGHEAFTSMRAHGAKVTDVVVLVVAADDGIMPQTIEAIDHAKAANVPILVAINKMDKPNVNSARIKKDLTKFDLVAEDWGGKTIFVNISAKTGKGIDELLEMLLLETEMLELKANADRPAEGTVIEAEIHKGKGAIATILVQKGTLKIGDTFICGGEFGKVKALINDIGRRIKEAGPITPVEVLGFSNVPPVGEVFTIVRDEKRARQISSIRKEKERERALKGVTHIHLEDFHREITAGKIKELRLILKTDVVGSATAIKESLKKIGSGKVKIKFLHSGAGGINESDVILAAASNAIIFGFNVVPDSIAQALADRENVDIHIYRIIYELIDEVKLAMSGLLEPTYKEIFTGRAEVRQLFRLPKAGVIAGSYMLSGKISRSNRIRIVRNSTIIHEGSILSLRRFKNDVKEVRAGLEFGIGIANFNDLKEGDLFEAYHMEEIASKL